MEKVLLIDAGNTRLKWAIAELSMAESSAVEPARWLEQGVASYDAFSELPSMWRRHGRLLACHAVNVAGAAAGESIEGLLASISLVPVWVRASAAACGVINRYHPPESLGADRWAALAGARRRTREACLVVSAGTALTVDALTQDGQFIGGMIAPGLHMMRQALAKNTAQVGEQYGNVLEFPVNTWDAVETGIVSALAGAVENMGARLAKISSARPRCLLTGGDAEALEPSLSLATERVPGLVLEGVYQIAREDDRT